MYPQLGHSLRHLEVRNMPASFRQLVRRCGAVSLYVMEAAGTYYLVLAYHLIAAGAELAVLNPIVVRHFIQSRQKKLS
ncbi:hypothetical protein E5K00_08380 [Hymenobacter aquaticus]|uniref:Uncharacterized protein n=1 Tax=Hymenobacter aquaticus TaxID=1867101 RepID=A0A4Z0Q703_9BACT|nr:hypothetical protein [Hymenobacter aquaticus]TGE25199.1 hypothetical protein E5K00_08380 [Hymenobacter aquaticus]